MSIPITPRKCYSLLFVSGVAVVHPRLLVLLRQHRGGGRLQEQGGRRWATVPTRQRVISGMTERGAVASTDSPFPAAVNVANVSTKVVLLHLLRAISAVRFL